jgi:hypothetical protein
MNGSILPPSQTSTASTGIICRTMLTFPKLLHEFNYSCRGFAVLNNITHRILHIQSSEHYRLLNSAFWCHVDLCRYRHFEKTVCIYLHFWRWRKKNFPKSLTPLLGVISQEMNTIGQDLKASCGGLMGNRSELQHYLEVLWKTVTKFRSPAESAELAGCRWANLLSA